MPAEAILILAAWVDVWIPVFLWLALGWALAVLTATMRGR